MSTLPLPERIGVSEGSLGQRIRGEIEARILSGAWGPGYRIPFEHELMVQYGCARMTVSKALSALVEAGLIERRRRAGSFVRKPSGQSAVLEIPHVKAEVQALGKAYRYELLHFRQRRPTPVDRVFLGESVDGPIIALTCRHFAGDEPFALEDRLIPLANVPEASEAIFRTEPPGTWLLNHVAWHEAEHLVSARAADARVAELLSLNVGNACLVVERHTRQTGKLITAVRLWYPGNSKSLVARFTPSSMAR